MLSRRQPARALLKADLPDSFTRSLYKISPYRGCAHACRYCDGRAEKYFVEGDFENDIEVRAGIPELLSKELLAQREEGMISLGSGTTDPYQPCEAEERISAGVATTLDAWNREAQPGTVPRFPAMVMSKSALVMRDLPLWKGVKEGAGFLLLMSITSLDEGLRELMEPGASPFQARLETLAAFKRAGCRTGMLAMPFLPGLSDSDTYIRKILGAAKDAGVDFAMPGGLTLRPGRQKDLYVSTLGQARPELLEMTRKLYSEERPSGAPLRSASQELMRRCSAILQELRLPFLLPHAAFKRLLPIHDSVRVLLRDMVELYGAKGIDIRPLKAAADRYDAWLIGKRRYFRRKRSLSWSWLSDELRGAEETGELSALLDNPKLAGFLHAVIAEDASFDYLSLKLH